VTVLLNAKNSFFNLEGKFIGVSVRSTRSVLQPLDTNAFVSIKDLVACFAGDSKLAAYSRHFLAVEKFCH